MTNANKCPTHELPDSWYGVRVNIACDYYDRETFLGVLQYSNAQGVMVGEPNGLFLPWGKIMSVSKARGSSSG